MTQSSTSMVQGTLSTSTATHYHDQSVDSSNSHPTNNATNHHHYHHQRHATESRVPKCVPHYAYPNASTLLPSYENSQLEAIRLAFQPTSFQRIQDLRISDMVCSSSPGSLTTDGTSFPSSSSSASNKNHHSQSAAEAAGGVGRPRPMHIGTSGGGTFSDFAYMPSPYDLDDATRRGAREDHNSRMKFVGGSQPFCAGFNTRKTHGDMHYQQEQKYNLYLELMSRGGGNGNGGSSNGADEADHTNNSEDLKRRDKWIRDGVQFSRPFVPPGVQKGTLSKPTRALLGDAINALHSSIAADWPDAPPTVVSTVEDLVVVYFKQIEIRNEAGIKAYMNHLLRRNDVVLEYDLRKVPVGWHVATEDGHWLYTLRPPWVRAKQFVTGDRSTAL